MNILILLKSLLGYKGAFYQSDIIKSLQINNNVFFYGPGYKDYNTNDTAETIIQKTNVKIDLIIFLHNSIQEDKSNLFSFFPNFENINITKIYFLNKEYMNLNKKINFARENKINYIITHHHKNKLYENMSGVKCFFMPFAVSKKYLIINYTKFKNRPIDIFSSGQIYNHQQIKNSYYYAYNKLPLYKEFYHMTFSVPIKKKKKYFDKEIKFFPDYQGHPFYRKWLYRLKSRNLNAAKIDSNEYYEYLGSSKICFTALSSMDLVTPKIFESMMVGTLTFSNSSEIYKHPSLQLEDYLVQFKDKEDFSSKINHYMYNPNQSQEIIDKAHKNCIENHTWEVRIEKLMNFLYN